VNDRRAARSPVRRAVVVSGGDPPDATVAGSLDEVDLVIGADSGAAHALDLGWRPDLVVGDLDSLAPGRLADLEAVGAAIQRHPTDKDRTDLALALDLAVAARPRHVTVLAGGVGERFDHLVASVLLLAAEAYSGVDLDAWFGTAHVTVVRGRASLRGGVGELLSLLAVNGPARGVTTTGLRWPLAGATLEPGSSWGVSNAFVSATAGVTVTGGVVLAVQPGRHT
jgi:thiamine pyrophosphokinase